MATMAARRRFRRDEARRLGRFVREEEPAGEESQATMPAATVSLVASSTRMKAPVPRDAA
jgi:hypothetical protein